jgi:hypothetical protein
VNWDAGTNEYDGDWHVWFAWRPVYATSSRGLRGVWLENVERRWCTSEVRELAWWDYRLLEPKA